MRQTRLLLTLLACLAACAPPKVPPPAKKLAASPAAAAKHAPQKPPAAKPAAQAPKKAGPKPFVLPPVDLAPEKIADGWIKLFDGTSLFGWTQPAGAPWTVRDAAIAAAPGGWLLSHQPFTDFRLRLQFRTGADGAARVALRAQPADPAASGFVIDPAAAKPKAGEWHFYDISARGSEYIVLLDGRLLLRARRFAPQAGYIALAGGAVEYRAVHLRPLDLACMFNGRNLDGWRPVQDTPAPPQPAAWSVRDGLLHGEHGPGQLEANYTFDDFFFQGDIRLNATGPAYHPTSALFFRGDRDVLWSGYQVDLGNGATGTLHGLQPARPSPARDNQWFTLTVTASGRRISVWVDGEPVTVWRDQRPTGLSLRDDKARLLRGTFAIQAHDPATNVDLRQLCIAPQPRQGER